MNIINKFLMIITAIGSVLGCNVNPNQAQTNRKFFTQIQSPIIAQSSRSNLQKNCKNNPAFQSAYSSGYLSGFNGTRQNNPYQGEGSRQCYELGYTDGLIKKTELNINKQQNDSSIYQMCLSRQLLDPSVRCYR